MLITIESLTKRYGNLTALDDCTFCVAEGEVLGLIGPNGAGKTTLMRLLLGFLRPTSGKAAIAGLDCTRRSLEVRRLVAYLPGEPRLSRQMRGRRILRFYCSLRRSASLALAEHIAERLELDLSRRVALMSTGMRQKLAIALTLAANTPLLILDEPTSNLDPTVRAEVLRLVAEARQSGRTVIFSSHILSEVEQICDRVAILRRGQLVHTQQMDEARIESVGLDSVYHEYHGGRE